MNFLVFCLQGKSVNNEILMYITVPKNKQYYAFNFSSYNLDYILKTKMLFLLCPDCYTFIFG